MSQTQTHDLDPYSIPLGTEGVEEWQARSLLRQIHLNTRIGFERLRYSAASIEALNFQRGDGYYVIATVGEHEAPLSFHIGDEYLALEAGNFRVLLTTRVNPTWSDYSYVQARLDDKSPWGKWAVWNRAVAIKSTALFGALLHKA